SLHGEFIKSVGHDLLLLELGVDDIVALARSTPGDRASRLRTRLTLAGLFVHVLREGVGGLVQFFHGLLDGRRVVARFLFFHLLDRRFNRRLRAGVDLFGVFLQQLLGLI